jgi:hypothetical protein
MADQGSRLSASDERVRAIRNRLWASRTRVEQALRYVMLAETRAELRNVLSDLAVALDHIGE